jgi:hypothetical protein
VGSKEFDPTDSHQLLPKIDFTVDQIIHWEQLANRQMYGSYLVIYTSQFYEIGFLCIVI